MPESEQQQATGSTSQQQQLQAPPHPQAGTSSSAHVYLSNLPVEAYEGTIRRAFEQQGIQVDAVELLKKGSFNRRHNSGLATVRLASAADAERCTLLDGKQLQVGADAASARPMIVRKDKFESCQLGYSPPQQPEQQQQEAAGSSADSDSSWGIFTWLSQESAALFAAGVRPTLVTEPA